VGSGKSDRRKVRKLLDSYKDAKRRVADEAEARAVAEERARVTHQAHQIVQEIAVKVQQKAHERIAHIVTRCLQAVFVEPWEFRITFERKRNKTEARFGFFLDGQEFDPKEGSAGGVIDVAAFGLRVASLLLQRPQRRKVLILDEPFKNINGQDNQDRAGALIETLSSETGIQFIIVTDDEWLKVGKVIKIA
jgi:ABC-type lipoprotein export system ATPase subunit